MSMGDQFKKLDDDYWKTNIDLKQEIQKLKEENKLLRDKLNLAVSCVEFYADYRNMLGDLYKQDLSDPFETEFSKTNERCIGKLARETLAKIKGEE